MGTASSPRRRYPGRWRHAWPIPKVKEFRAFSEAGRKLSELHLNYETVEPYPLDEQRKVNATYRVEKMKYRKTGRITDKSTVIYNGGITVSGIPDEAHEYMLGSRSAIDWIIERYQVKTDKASGTVNDPNDWAQEQGNPRYIFDLLARIETVKIVNSLPQLELFEPEEMVQVVPPLVLGTPSPWDLSRRCCCWPGCCSSAHRGASHYGLNASNPPDVLVLDETPGGACTA